ncbi:MAG TPA: acyl carrier protein [Acidobacteriaceae bacterium]|jgi:acyl carrier protein|nr:acyl carrier protein [Acidobacteriaceae bacterium]
MTEIESKLLECMKAVFPTIPEESLPDASVANLEQWDSLATVTIVALIEESFEIEVEPADLVKLTSIRNIVAFLKEHGAKTEVH